jgi:hypothetical protein
MADTGTAKAVHPTTRPAARPPHGFVRNLNGCVKPPLQMCSFLMKTPPREVMRFVVAAGLILVIGGLALALHLRRGQCDASPSVQGTEGAQ